MGKKIDFGALNNIDEDHHILKDTEKSQRKSDAEKLTAQIKVNLKQREKKQLEKVAGRNMSAFVRDVLIEQGIIH